MLAEPESNPPPRRPPYGIYAYTAREWDPEINLYYYRARYYDPTVGRFISEDPLPVQIRPQNELNPYAYVRGNPASRLDPSGLTTGVEELVLVLGCSPDPLTKILLATLAAAGIAVTIVYICERCKDDPYEDDEPDCEAQREADEERCRRQFTSGGMKRLCWQNVMDRYSDCLAGRTPRPHFPID